jgi:hypothetical protein
VSSLAWASNSKLLRQRYKAFLVDAGRDLTSIHRRRWLSLTTQRRRPERPGGASRREGRGVGDSTNRRCDRCAGDLSRGERLVSTRSAGSRWHENLRPGSSARPQRAGKDAARRSERPPATTPPPSLRGLNSSESNDWTQIGVGPHNPAVARSRPSNGNREATTREGTES